MTINVFHDEIRTITAHVFLYVNPWNANAVAFHPLRNCWVGWWIIGAVVVLSGIAVIVAAKSR